VATDNILLAKEILEKLMTKFQMSAMRTLRLIIGLEVEISRAFIILPQKNYSKLLVDKYCKECKRSCLQPKQF
jgi:hypothetical protein